MFLNPLWNNVSTIALKLMFYDGVSQGSDVFNLNLDCVAWHEVFWLRLHEDGYA